MVLLCIQGYKLWSMKSPQVTSIWSHLACKDFSWSGAQSLHYKNITLESALTPIPAYVCLSVHSSFIHVFSLNKHLAGTCRVSGLLTVTAQLMELTDYQGEKWGRKTSSKWAPTKHLQHCDGYTREDKDFMRKESGRVSGRQQQRSRWRRRLRP